MVFPPVRRWGWAMTASDDVTRPGGASPVRRVAAWSAITLGLTVVALLAGVGVAAMLSRRGAAEDWQRWSDVGQTFGVLSSIISGLALAALVVTGRAQFREMQQNRWELERQRDSLSKNHAELQRTAEANLRMVHVEMLKMGIMDSELAEVWPAFEPGLSVEKNRQYLYANIIYQYHFASLRLSEYSSEQVLASLRYLFTSPLMRSYWAAAAFARTSLEPGTAEFEFAQQVDLVCREYEAVVASARPGPADHRSTGASVPLPRVDKLGVQEAAV